MSWFVQKEVYVFFRIQFKVPLFFVHLGQPWHARSNILDLLTEASGSGSQIEESQQLRRQAVSGTQQKM